MNIVQDPPTQNLGSATVNVPDRFQTAPRTLFIDKFMNHFIRGGGIAVIAAVIGIFVFITAQTIPLFQGAKVKPLSTIQLDIQNVAALATDEWAEVPFVVDQEGVIHFIDVMHGNEVRTVVPNEENLQEISTIRYVPHRQEIVYGTKDGKVFKAVVSFRPEYSGDERTIKESVKITPVYQAGQVGKPIIDVAYGDSSEQKLFGVIQQLDSGFGIYGLKLKQKRSLLGAGKVIVDGDFDISDQVEGTPTKIMVNSQADGIIVATEEGEVFFFYEDDGDVELRQRFKPFEGESNESIATIDYLFGEVSLIVTNAAGLNYVYSLSVPEGEILRKYTRTKTFDSLPGGATFFNPSLRNKAFLTGTPNFATLRYSTNESVRWEKAMPFNIEYGIIGRKYSKLLFLDDQEQLHFFELDDPHPEAGIKAFFGKLWYEGYSAPSYEWQSTGGTDDFEPKLSLIPLIVGTFKGTFYAMLFALPIAVIAALYTSQFSHPKFRLFVKPMMEIMASLPSVVLGFLAALWLAPIIETKVVSLLAIFILMPTTAFVFGWLWTRLPIQYRRVVKPGYEWIVLMPVTLGAIMIGWELGPILERAFFVVTDPITGQSIADFRLWWPEATGTPFEQRNSMVVGFMMGFAVIPIIFTISEDSLSNVPKVLVSGSLALGASRWQTAVRVVTPTAFPGIFSATMIGLGRAVGETMIVVMATGNTPIMDFNIFSGMRTLSANIAVELPEAPYLGTLYRTLFLGAVVLFVLTFIVNTIAEIIRQHLREKYKTV